MTNDANSTVASAPETDAATKSDSSESTSETSTQATTSSPSAFEEAAQDDQQVGIVREFLEFLGESKSWWLTPIIVVLLLVGILVLLSGTVIAPFIYPIF